MAAASEFHRQSVEEICELFNTSAEHGLTLAQVEENREKYGDNMLRGEKEDIGQSLLKSYCDANGCCFVVEMVLLLIFGAIYSQTLMIIFGIILGLLIGLKLWNSFQLFEESSKQDVFDLGKLVTSGIIRDHINRSKLLVSGYLKLHGVIDAAYEKKYNDDIRDLLSAYLTDIDSTLLDQDIVCGDVITLKAGDHIPADMRVIECSKDFAVDNSSLTGECEPIKRSNEMTNEMALESENLLFLGTSCVKGYGKAIVVNTGNNSFMGQVAKLAMPFAYEENDMIRVTINQIKKGCGIILFVIVLMTVILNGTISINDTGNGILLGIGVLTITLGLAGIFYMSRLSVNYFYQLENDIKLVVKSRLSCVEYLPSINVIVTGINNIIVDGYTIDENGNVSNVKLKKGMKEAINLCRELGVVLLIATKSSRKVANAVSKELLGDEYNEDINIEMPWPQMDEYEMKIDETLLANGEQNILQVMSDVDARDTLVTVRNVQHASQKVVAFISNGLNQAPALKMSDFGVAMHDSRSTDVERTACDAICYQDNPVISLLQAIQLGKNMAKKIPFSARFNRRYL